jgi:hypothetical protein
MQSVVNRGIRAENSSGAFARAIISLSGAYMCMCHARRYRLHSTLNAPLFQIAVESKGRGALGRRRYENMISALAERRTDSDRRRARRRS